MERQDSGSKTVDAAACSPSNVKDILNVHVGRAVHFVMRSTLLKEPGSKLAEVFLTKDPSKMPEWATFKDGEYFIDCHPSAFHYILQYLQGTGCEWPGMLYHRTRNTAVTMGLDSLIAILDNMHKEKEAEKEHPSEEEKREKELRRADIRSDMERLLLTISTSTEDKVVEWAEQMYRD